MRSTRSVYTLTETATGRCIVCDTDATTTEIKRYRAPYVDAINRGSLTEAVTANELDDTFDF